MPPTSGLKFDCIDRSLHLHSLPSSFSLSGRLLVFVVAVVVVVLNLGFRRDLSWIVVIIYDIPSIDCIYWFVPVRPSFVVVDAFYHRCCCHHHHPFQYHHFHEYDDDDRVTELHRHHHDLLVLISLRCRK